MFRFATLLIPSVLLVGFCADLAYAQPGGDSRSRGFMSFLDRNRNGVIEASEFDQMPGRFKETLEAAGVNTSRDMSQQEFERIMPQVMERMRSQRSSFGGGDRSSDDRSRFGSSRGFGGPPGGFGGPPGGFSQPGGDGDDGNDDRSGGFDRDAMRSRYGSFEPDRGGSSDFSSSGRSGGSSSGNSSKNEPAKPVRTTVDLNQEFVPHDMDQDGQIGLYEWRKNNPTKLSEFFTMDLNGDGYLTPKEIKLAKEGKTQRSAASFMFALNTGQPAANPLATGGSTSASGSTETPKQSTPEKPSQPESVQVSAPTTDPLVAQAGYFFKLVDRDKDGSVSPEEWKKSRSMRKLFEEANIDLTVSMPQEQFVKHYLEIKKK
ncbi:EF-hand domain-containing protein [Gimesia sp.]|uniref:EF-hand domain-containing protein n=1 Tax=Gimesia sp. TaxID=2024833 RepID=UPI0025BF742A|nr:EF-hand domain-containing protein [Gimesia sp.]